MSGRKALFLDRDGVINKRAQPGKYILSPQEFELLPGVLEALKLAKKRGCLVIVVTNQSCVGKGLISEEGLRELHEHLKKLLSENGKCLVDAAYHCPHLATENCACRKPGPKMFFDAAKQFGIDLSQSIFIGDSETDLQAGKAAGCPTFLIKEGESLLQLVARSLQPN